jgi:hypothetical protein
MRLAPVRIFAHERLDGISGGPFNFLGRFSLERMFSQPNPSLLRIGLRRHFAERPR